MSKVGNHEEESRKVESKLIGSSELQTEGVDGWLRNLESTT